MGIKDFINKVKLSKQLASMPGGLNMGAMQAIAQKIMLSLNPADQEQFVALAKSQNVNAILTFIKEKNINLEALVSEEMSKAS
jgi:hypothetical protein